MRGERLVQEISEAYIREMVQPRPWDAHKGDCGRVLLVCGSSGMTGAAVMSARAALRSGAGLVTVCLPRYLFPILQTAVPEAMCIEPASIVYGSLDLQQFDCIGAGPGLGVSREQYQMIEHLLVSYRGPMVLDADGLNGLCRYARVPDRSAGAGEEPEPDWESLGIPRPMISLLPEMIAHRKHPVIMTPHPGEADRLLASLDQRKYKELGRERAAEVLAEKTGAIVVLKGPQTLVARSNGPAAADSAGETELFINSTGNPGMATGGSGDVLTGVIAAITAGGRARTRRGKPGISPMDAARTGVYMHGLAGDIAAGRLGEIGMTAMDIAEALPEAFFRICGR